MYSCRVGLSMCVSTWCETHPEFLNVSIRAPPYICEIVTKYEPRRQLRRSGKCMLVVPKIRTKGDGARSLFYASAMLRNYVFDDRLTEADSVAVFKGRLKTYLSNRYFS